MPTRPSADNAIFVNGQPYSDATVEYEQGGERVFSYMPEPDPEWRYTDAAGHEHYREGHRYPTLVTVHDYTYWCEHCRDEHDVTHLECPLCGEHIVPGTRPASPTGTWIPGQVRITATVTGLPVGYDPGDEVAVQFADRQFTGYVVSVEGGFGELLRTRIDLVPRGSGPSDG